MLATIKINGENYTASIQSYDFICRLTCIIVFFLNSSTVVPEILEIIIWTAEKPYAVKSRPVISVSS